MHVYMIFSQDFREASDNIDLRSFPQTRASYSPSNRHLIELMFSTAKFEWFPWYVEVFIRMQGIVDRLRANEVVNGTLFTLFVSSPCIARAVILDFLSKHVACIILIATWYYSQTVLLISFNPFQNVSCETSELLGKVRVFVSVCAERYVRYKKSWSVDTLLCKLIASPRTKIT